MTSGECSDAVEWRAGDERRLVDGRTFALAFLSVQLAALDEQDGSVKPEINRAVLVEVFEGRGLQLIASDGYWLAVCWCPFEDAPADAPPPESQQPDDQVIVADRDWRLRDLLKHIVRLTKPPSATSEREQVEVSLSVDLRVRIIDPDNPPLAEDMAETRAAFEIENVERVTAKVIDGVFPNWRTVIDRGPVEEYEGVRRVMLSGWLLGRLSRIETLAGGQWVTVDWVNESCARWRVESPFTTRSLPFGLLMARVERPPESDSPDEVDPVDGPTPPDNVDAATGEVVADLDEARARKRKRGSK